MKMAFKVGVLLLAVTLLHAAIVHGRAGVQQPRQLNVGNVREFLRERLEELHSEVNEMFNTATEDVPHLIRNLEDFFHDRARDADGQPQTFREVFFQSEDFCSVCRRYLTEFVELSASTLSPEQFERFLEVVCQLYEPDGTYCSLGTKQILLPLLDAQKHNTEGLDFDYACWALSSGRCLDAEDKVPQLMWEKDLSHYLDSQKKIVQEKDSSEDFKVLQITDLHVDTSYDENSKGFLAFGSCIEPGSYPNAAYNLSEFGSARSCGIPEKTFDSLIEHIRNQHLSEVKYIIDSGDKVNSAFWIQDRDRNLQLFQTVSQVMQDNWAKVPVFPVLGNRDVVPVNQFIPPSAESWDPTAYIYKEAADKWVKAGWVSMEQKPRIEENGFYTADISDELRLVAINTLYCYKMNWWSYADSFSDPGKQLEQLAEELQKAEDEGKFVHLLGHVSPGSEDCNPTWYHHFSKILHRYEDVIRAQFYGHEGSDFLINVQYYGGSRDKAAAKGLAFIGPSIHSLLSNYPQYTVYTIDGASKRVKNLEVWFLDLEAADEAEEAIWTKLFNFEEAWGKFPSNTQEWHDFVVQLEENEELRQRFYNLTQKAKPMKPYTEARGIKQLEQMVAHDEHFKQWWKKFVHHATEEILDPELNRLNTLSVK
ncbi:unnamed protein product [Cyprideis torosa]|uniref:Calcineurin-like phosphoesterase domain-containing protein n=1 Tax=Cyprideis torosa TaxID=163714 RepID=A0A7R8ZGM1_9CRUS|nr:unnamed protein product [Cyprideis torosa]CAG0880395.1 unnamed protein product [Cyprideis torosa]